LNNDDDDDDDLSVTNILKPSHCVLLTITIVAWYKKCPLISTSRLKEKLAIIMQDVRCSQ